MAHLQLQGEGGFEVDGLLSTVVVAEERLEVDRLAGREVYPEMDSLLSTAAVAEVDRLAGMQPRSREGGVACGDVPEKHESQAECYSADGRETIRKQWQSLRGIF